MGPNPAGLVSVSKGEIGRQTGRQIHARTHNMRRTPREGEDGNPGDASTSQREPKIASNPPKLGEGLGAFSLTDLPRDQPCSPPAQTPGSSTGRHSCCLDHLSGLLGPPQETNPQPYWEQSHLIIGRLRGA